VAGLRLPSKKWYPKKSKPLLIRPTNVLSGCVKSRRPSNVDWTVWTARRSFQRVGARMLQSVSNFPDVVQHVLMPRNSTIILCRFINLKTVRLAHSGAFIDLTNKVFIDADEPFGLCGHSAAAKASDAGSSASCRRALRSLLRVVAVVVRLASS
jgi:hypothetical protein